MNRNQRIQLADWLLAAAASGRAATAKAEQELRETAVEVLDKLARDIAEVQRLERNYGR